MKKLIQKLIDNWDDLPHVGICAKLEELEDDTSKVNKTLDYLWERIQSYQGISLIPHIQKNCHKRPVSYFWFPHSVNPAKYRIEFLNWVLKN